jgi:hypothetical protein
MTNLGEVTMSNDTSFMIEIAPDSTTAHATDLYRPTDAPSNAHDIATVHPTAHDITTVHPTDLCQHHDNPDPSLTVGLDPTQYQQQTATSTWQQLHTIPATGLHFKHVLWDYQITPWTSDIASTIHWPLLYGNHQTMQPTEEIGETQKSPLLYSIVRVIPKKTLLVSNFFSWDPYHPDFTSSHTVFELPQARLHLDSLTNMSICLQLFQHRPCPSLMRIACPFQTGYHYVRAEVLDLPSLIKPYIAQQVLYYWDTTVFTQVPLREVQPDIEKYVSPSWILDSDTITDLVLNTSDQPSASSVAQVSKFYAHWQHTTKSWIHPIILLRILQDRNPPLMYKNHTSSTSSIYEKFDEGSTAKFVSNGFLTLDPGKRDYPSCVSHSRGAFEFTSSIDPLLNLAILNAGYQSFHMSNREVLNSKYNFPSTKFVMHPKVGYFACDPFNHATTTSIINGINRLIKLKPLAITFGGVEVVLPLWNISRLVVCLSQ